MIYDSSSSSSSSNIQLQVKVELFFSYTNSLTTFSSTRFLRLCSAVVTSDVPDDPDPRGERPPHRRLHARTTATRLSSLAIAANAQFTPPAGHDKSSSSSSSSSWSRGRLGPSRRCTNMSTVDSTPPELSSRTGGIVS